MLFSSLEFIFFFLPITLFGYFLLNKLRLTLAATAWLVFTSLFFYAWWNPYNLGLIIGSMLGNYALGASLHRIKRRGRHQISRAALLFAGVAANLSLLGYFKYAGFFISITSTAFDLKLTPLDIALPLAISFFTFTQIAYLVDCFQTDTQEYDFLNYVLFVTFFPHLIAGPIVHHRDIMPQLARAGNKVLRPKNLILGLIVFSLGLFKKVVIADSFAVFATAGFDHDIPLGIIDAWAVSLSYTFQLYYDFSGYSDMAVGLALMFNVRFPINFDSPYKSGSIKEFWRRWHITLSRFLRDYLYIPLGGNRLGSVRTQTNILTTMILGGLWHGAGWTFLIWGAMHGIALVTQYIWSKFALFKIPFVAGWACTFLFVNATWVFFRAPSFGDAQRILGGMIGLGGSTPDGKLWELASSAGGLVLPYIPPETWTTQSACFAFCLLFGVFTLLSPNIMKMSGFIPDQGRFRLNRNAITALLTGLAFGTSVLQLLASKGSEFLYFNF